MFHDPRSRNDVREWWENTWKERESLAHVLLLLSEEGIGRGDRPESKKLQNE